MTRMVTHDRAFNSLSRDHSRDVVLIKTLNIVDAFNSLSRDHLWNLASTLDRVALVFQLPLSGSLVLNSMSLITTESTFNSLSRDHINIGSENREKMRHDPFNSLSRDHESVDQPIT